MYYQDVYLPLDYAHKYWIKITLDYINTAYCKRSLVNGDIDPSAMFALLQTNNTKAITNTLAKNFNMSGYISIEKQLKPLLIKEYENITAFNLLKCNTLGICPILWRSLSSLIPNFSIIGNVSKSTGILILNGENDSQTPVQQAFLLQQRLTELIILIIR